MSSRLLDTDREVFASLIIKKHCRYLHVLADVVLDMHCLGVLKTDSRKHTVVYC